MATAPKNPNWTQAHESALTGLTGLGIPKKQARSLLEALPAGDLGSMMREALKGHVKSRNLVPVPNGPQGAAPIMPPPGPAAKPVAAAAAQTKPSMLRSFVPPRAPLQAAAAASENAPKINLRNFIPTQKAPSPKAPEEPAPEGKPPYTQIVGAPPGWKPSDAGLPKPRIRVRAAGQKIPAAPLGSEAPSGEATSPTEAPQVPTEGQQSPSKKKPLVFISTQREYDQLEPGTEFVWPNGRVYEKPAAES